jgi:hypothetical protein
MSTIDTPIGSDRLGNQGLNRRRKRHIGMYERGLAPGLFDLRHRLLTASHRHIRHDYLGPFSDAGQGRGPTNA